MLAPAIEALEVQGAPAGPSAAPHALCFCSSGDFSHIVVTLAPACELPAATMFAVDSLTGEVLSSFMPPLPSPGAS